MTNRLSPQFPGSKRHKAPVRRRLDFKDKLLPSPVMLTAVTGLDDVKLVGLTDQDGNRWLKVIQGSNESVTLLNQVFTNQSLFFKDLVAENIVISSSSSQSKIRTAIDTIKDWHTRIYVASSPGHHNDSFVLPDGQVVLGAHHKPFTVRLPNPIKPLASAGTFEQWKNLVRQFVVDQPYLLLPLCLAFVGPILELSPLAGNVGLELVGPSSTGKGNVLNLCASVWGAPSNMTGSIAKTWLTTVAGAEDSMLAHAGSFLPLDEANHLGVNKDNVSKAHDTIFMLSEGPGKSRHKDPAKVRTRLAFFSTANVPTESLVQTLGRQRSEAFGVRLLTLTIDPKNVSGVFSRLPTGFATSGEAIKAVEAGLAANHGHGARCFLQRLLRDEYKDDAALRRRIKGYVDRFVNLTKVDRSDGIQLRRAEAVGLCYAAGRLARHYGILPVPRISKPLLTAFRQMEADRLLTRRDNDPLEVIKAYVEKHKAEIPDLTTESYEDLENVDDVPAFLKIINGQRYVLIRSGAWKKLFGADSRGAARMLKSNNLLLASGGFHYQTRLRKNSTKDRVYAVLID